ncbi:hypothetical protein [Sedimentitalea arenosa]|uniref:hypothetical protein n=1 Tax=Sedimentitalea arenosa TaxID=2798803 RepID=UPI0018EA920D|nr:hypothetical protein [Arenibacterium arenosum]
MSIESCAVAPVAAIAVRTKTDNVMFNRLIFKSPKILALSRGLAVVEPLPCAWQRLGPRFHGLRGLFCQELSFPHMDQCQKSPTGSLTGSNRRGRASVIGFESFDIQPG